MTGARRQLLRWSWPDAAVPTAPVLAGDLVQAAGLAATYVALAVLPSSARVEVPASPVGLAGRVAALPLPGAEGGLPVADAPALHGYRIGPGAELTLSVPTGLALTLHAVVTASSTDGGAAATVLAVRSATRSALAGADVAREVVRGQEQVARMRRLGASATEVEQVETQVSVLRCAAELRADVRRSPALADERATRFERLHWLLPEDTNRSLAAVPARAYELALDELLRRVTEIGGSTSTVELSDPA